jgi:hypothetical protein
MLLLATEGLRRDGCEFVYLFKASPLQREPASPHWQLVSCPALALNEVYTDPPDCRTPARSGPIMMRAACFHRSKLFLPCIRARTKCATITSNARSQKQRNGHAQNERGDRGEERDAVGRQAATQLRRCRGFLLRGRSLRSANLPSVLDRSVEQAKQVLCLCHGERGECVGFGEVGDGNDVLLRITASVCHSVGMCTCSRGAKVGVATRLCEARGFTGRFDQLEGLQEQS